MRRRTLLSLLPCPLLATATQRFEATEPHMGTLVRIVLHAESDAMAHAGLRAAFARVAALDRLLSDYSPDSELRRVCREAVAKPVRVSEELFAVLWAAQEIAEATAGAFDVTLGAATHLWRRARREQRRPSRKEVEEARQRTGYRHLLLDPKRGLVRLGKPGMLLDVGGIAKGYVAGEALRVLRAHGMRSALVAASGDIVVGDAPPGRAGWRVRVEPLPSWGLSKTLVLQRAAVSTSGDAEQHLESEGKRYSHILDAAGEGLTVRRGVTSVASCGMQSDGWATAVSVLGLPEGILTAEWAGIAAWVAQVESGVVQERMSAGFERWVDG